MTCELSEVWELKEMDVVTHGPMVWGQKRYSQKVSSQVLGEVRLNRLGEVLLTPFICEYEGRLVQKIPGKASDDSFRGCVNRDMQTVNWEAGKEGGCRDRCQERPEKYT